MPSRSAAAWPSTLKLGASYFLSGPMSITGAAALQPPVRPSGSSTVDAAQDRKVRFAAAPKSYRTVIKEAILAADSTATIVEPLDIIGLLSSELFPDGSPPSEVNDTQVLRAFNLTVNAAATADVVVAYLPEVSIDTMGSEAEMQAAKSAGKWIFVIAPGAMSQHRMVKRYADRVLSSLEEFREHLTENVIWSSPPS